MDRDRWELPRTAEPVTLRRQPDMAVRVELINSTDRTMTIETVGARPADILYLDHQFLRDGVPLFMSVARCYAEGQRVELKPGGRAFNEISLADYSGPDGPLAAGTYRLQVTLWSPELKEKHPLLEKWVDLKIVD